MATNISACFVGCVALATSACGFASDSSQVVEKLKIPEVDPKFGS
jgi:hypothetical protein